MERCTNPAPVLHKVKRTGCVNWIKQAVICQVFLKGSEEKLLSTLIFCQTQSSSSQSLCFLLIYNTQQSVDRQVKSMKACAVENQPASTCFAATSSPAPVKEPCQTWITASHCTQHEERVHTFVCFFVCDVSGLCCMIYFSLEEEVNAKAFKTYFVPFFFFLVTCLHFLPAFGNVWGLKSSDSDKAFVFQILAGGCVGSYYNGQFK